MAVLYGETFGTKVRCSGMAIGTQIGFALGAFSPAIATGIAGVGQNAWLPVAWFTAAAATVAGLCAPTARATAHVPLAELGAPATRVDDRQFADV